jgi:hypothetical protein
LSAPAVEGDASKQEASGETDQRRLAAMRQPGESYSDVILRLVGLEAR